MSSAARRWRDELAAWSIPDDIMRRAPESPWGFPVGLWRARAVEGRADTPSRRRAREALPKGGTVLDVGAGTGAASLSLAPPAGTIVAVDESSEMLAAFAEFAAEKGIGHDEIEGTWPDAADRAPVADVVVTRDVLYNVADLASFALALGDHARYRVVAEITAAHPMADLNHIWRHLHGLDRPEGPSATDALAVLQEAGIVARLESWARPPRIVHDRAEFVAFVRRRMCVSPARDAEIDALIGPELTIQERPAATIWWDA